MNESSHVGPRPMELRNKRNGNVQTRHPHTQHPWHLQEHPRNLWHPTSLPEAKRRRNPWTLVRASLASSGASLASSGASPESLISHELPGGETSTTPLDPIPIPGILVKASLASSGASPESLTSHELPGGETSTEAFGPIRVLGILVGASLASSGASPESLASHELAGGKKH